MLKLILVEESKLNELFDEPNESHCNYFGCYLPDTKTIAIGRPNFFLRKLISIIHELLHFLLDVITEDEYFYDKFSDILDEINENKRLKL